jgi:hypothetical protein
MSQAAFIEQIKEDRAKLRRQIEQLENGSLTLRSQTLGSPATDTTAETLEHLRRCAIELDAILARHPDA